MPVSAIAEPEILHDIVGQVEAIEDRGAGLFDVRIGLATATTGLDAGQFLNMVFGNTSLHDDVVLLDVEIPAEFAASFGGPRHGIDGLRRRIGAVGRALTCSALKPQGVPPARLAELAAAVRPRRHRLHQGRPRPGRPALLAIRRTRRRDRQSRREHRPRHALRAQPVGRSRRDAPPDRDRTLARHRHGADRADDRRLGEFPGVGAAVPRHCVLRASHHGRRRAHRAGAADRQAVPPARRGCGDLPQPWRPLRLHAGHLSPSGRPGPRTVGRHPPQRAGAGRRHDARPRAGDA